MGTEVCLGREKSQETDGGDGCPKMYLMPLKMVNVVNFVLCVFYHDMNKYMKF